MSSQTPSPDLPVGCEEGLTQALQAALIERDALADHAKTLEIALAETRARPIKGLKDYAVFRVLEALSRLSPPLPRRTAMRFARSALKRNPWRSLPARDHEARAAATVRQRGGYTLTGQAAREPGRPDVLVVSHEASRTGAPILALNLVEQLGQRFNVTCYLVRGGECVADFAAAAVRVFVGEGMPRDDQDGLVQTMCGETRFAFAIVNSAESHGVLAGLARAEVPTVSLIHEFASLIRPVEVLERLVRHSDDLVFSSRTTQASALAAHPGFATAALHVIPQGKCRVPVDGPAQAKRAAEQAHLRRLLRPEGRDGCVVLGAGTVNLRKGVDLFVEMARRVLSRPGGENVRFFWIGGGFDPKSTDIYIVHLLDQLSRAGVRDRVTMLRETAGSRRLASAPVQGPGVRHDNSGPGRLRLHRLAGRGCAAGGGTAGARL